jgi:hypothetical protein
MIDYRKATAAEIEHALQKTKENNSKMEILLENERNFYNNEIRPLFETLNNNDLKIFSQLQGNSLSLAETLTMKISDHLSKLSKLKVSLKKYEADRFEFYSTGFGIKVADTKKSIFIDRDLAESQRKVEMVEIHIDFLRELRKKCYDIGYAIKNRIELLNLMRL